MVLQPTVDYNVVFLSRYQSAIDVRFRVRIGAEEAVSHSFRLIRAIFYKPEQGELVLATDEMMFGAMSTINEKVDQALGKISILHLMYLKMCQMLCSLTGTSIEVTSSPTSVVESV